MGAGKDLEVAQGSKGRYWEQKRVRWVYEKLRYVAGEVLGLGSSGKLYEIVAESLRNYYLKCVDSPAEYRLDWD